MKDQEEFDDQFHQIMIMESASEIDSLINRVADIEARIRASARSDDQDADIQAMVEEALFEISQLPPESLPSAVLCAVDLANAIRDQLDHIVNVLGNSRDIMAQSARLLGREGAITGVRAALEAAVAVIDTTIRRREQP